MGHELHGGPKRTSYARQRKSIAPQSARETVRGKSVFAHLRGSDMAKRTKPSIDAVEIIHRRFYEGKPARLKSLEEARANEEIARKIRDLRAAAGLTQTQFAKLIDTTASVICRLEDADYEGHSLAMLRRIAGALNQRVEIQFVPIRRSA
jgi:DNA-binding XRE family transcriptional regulator